MRPIDEFEEQKKKNIQELGKPPYKAMGTAFVRDTAAAHYSYNFSWLGRPIIQFPQDIVALQEIIWAVKPDLIIETGIAHGGSLILSASLLTLLESTKQISSGQVIGIDIDIRAHNRTAIEAHPLASKITMIQGSSIDPLIITKVTDIARKHRTIMIILDSNHTHEHVMAELHAYAPLVTKGSYCIVFDTSVEDMPEDMFKDRPWGKGNNPRTAVRAFLKDHTEFIVDHSIEDKLLITVATEGYLKKVR